MISKIMQSKKYIGFLLLFLIACSGNKMTFIQPQAADYSFFCAYTRQTNLETAFAKKSVQPLEIGLRSCDLSAMDLSSLPPDFEDVISFDSKTRWPDHSKMPVNVNIERIMQEGANPGLGVRTLHSWGIDGRGVTIAIIDQPLLTTHQEYADRLIAYEQQNPADNEASMHGSAVASIALGNTVGVAPKALFYYIAAEFREEDGIFDARPITRALKEIYNINRRLEPKDKIRVVSISRGFGPTDLGAKEFIKMRQKLEKSGVAVFTTSEGDPIFALSRRHASSPADDITEYTRAASWFSARETGFYEHMQEVLFPIDYRVTASPAADTAYVFYQNGGLSWAVPYAAGLYALAVQVYPALTPDLFWRLAKKTAVRSFVQSADGKTHPANYLVQPQALIDHLRQLTE